MNPELENLLQEQPDSVEQTRQWMERLLKPVYEQLKLKYEAQYDQFELLSDERIDLKEEELIAASKQTENEEEWYTAVATIMGTTLEEVHAYYALQKVIKSELNQTQEMHMILAEERALMKNSPAKKLQHKKGVVYNLEVPALVFYTADRCPPCREVKPTIARLFHFFSEGKAYYEDEPEFDFKKSRGVRRIPSFVAYTENSQIFSPVPRTTERIWEVMNTLMDVAKKEEGSYNLVLSEEKGYVLEPRKLDWAHLENIG